MNEIREDLKAFVDGELTPERMNEVRLAIEADPALQQEVEYMRLLGMEIRRLAAEPEVVGKEAAVSKFRRAALPWWNPATLTGRFAYAGALFLVLAGTSAILFPVFAQSKSASKRLAGADVAMSKMPLEERAASPSSDANLRIQRPMDGSVPSEGESNLPAKGMSQGGFAGSASPESPAYRYGDTAGETADSTKTQQPPVDSETLNGQVFAEIEPAEPTAPESKAAVGANKENAKKATSGKTKFRTLPQRDKTQAASPSGKPLPEAPPLNRLVVKNADISVKVEDARKALTDVEALAKQLGGYVEGGNLSAPEDGDATASATLRVPFQSYESAMKSLREMGEVLSENSSAADVTAQHADAEGRVKALRAEEQSYLTMLRGAKTTGQIMEIKDRLGQVRQEIASYESQRKALSSASALSTIRATFTQKAGNVGKKKDDGNGSGFDETWARAQNGLSKVGEFLGNLAIYLFVFSPVWLPPVLLFWWLGRRARA